MHNSRFIKICARFNSNTAYQDEKLIINITFQICFCLILKEKRANKQQLRYLITFMHNLLTTSCIPLNKTLTEFLKLNKSTKQKIRQRIYEQAHIL